MSGSNRLSQYILLTLSLSVLAIAGCGGGGSHGGATGAGTGSLTGTVPGTLIEASGEDGSLYRVHSTDNGTTRHPFRLDLPAGKVFTLTMTTNEGSADSVTTPIGFTDGSQQVVNKFSLDSGSTIDLGNIPLPMSRQASPPAHVEGNDDFILDKPLVVDSASVDNRGHLEEVKTASNDNGDSGQQDTGNHSNHDGSTDTGTGSQGDSGQDNGSGNDSTDGGNTMAGGNSGEGDTDDGNTGGGNTGGGNTGGGNTGGGNTGGGNTGGGNTGGGNTGGGNTGNLSITTTNSNGPVPASPVSQQPFVTLPGFQISAINDLGMHCADLDQRVVAILPPFNIVHAQVIKRGKEPTILSDADVETVYSGASNPNDPVLSNPVQHSINNNGTIFKSNFWDINPRTGNTLGFDLMDPFYPAGVLASLGYNLPGSIDTGLPVPDPAQLPALVADQQDLPGKTDPYNVNAPKAFKRYDRNLPFFNNFAFGYTQQGINWFAADGIPLSFADDAGRENAYPLMRVQARAVAGNNLGETAGTVLASVDTVLPISVEADCKACHTSSLDLGNGEAACDPTFDSGCPAGGGSKRSQTPFTVAFAGDDPNPDSTQLQSDEWAADTNIVRLHDAKHGTHLVDQTPVMCQTCHYTPALDLAQVGPSNDNGKDQVNHKSMSNVMHSFHGQFKDLFPDMPAPGSNQQARLDVLDQTCYNCHPGKRTRCLRGAMFNRGVLCQDCHGGMEQVGNDFSRDVSPANPGAFIVKGDFYTNPATPRVPWANVPMCQSCHTGDANSNLTGSTGTLVSQTDTDGKPDGLRLLQAWRTGDTTAKPIVAVNRRFAENQVSDANGTRQVLYRLSKGHKGVFCEACHGSTHAIWPDANPNANDNVAASQLQGHTGKIVECSTCHTGDLGVNLDGPHGMHPVGDAGVNFAEGGHEDFAEKNLQACAACHGSRGQGTVLAKMAATRTFNVEDKGLVTLQKDSLVSCSLCHENPF